LWAECEDCGLAASHHVLTWLDELTGRLLPHIALSWQVEATLDALLEKCFTTMRLATLRDDFALVDIPLRTACFIEEARQRGVKFRALYGPWGPTNFFRAEVNGRIFRFEGLPIASFRSGYGASRLDDKARTKAHLRKGGFPVADGRSFWFFQKRQAMAYARHRLGFPVVVKPRSGSVSRHVTTDIHDGGTLERAIGHAIRYSPAFLIERFIPEAFVHRATVVDFTFVAAVTQLAAHVIGDGRSTIAGLIGQKNADPRRWDPRQHGFLYAKIAVNEMTQKLLTSRGYALTSVPKAGQRVYLERDPFLKLGGDLIEVTPDMHPENVKLFQAIARWFDVPIVGIDFLARDISRPWHEQPSAVLELNSLPCIEMHHFPIAGRPQNVARAVVELFFKYYVSA